MKKVKEFLDKYFVPDDDNYITPKDNGHYKLMGGWGFVDNKNKFEVSCNNETLSLHYYQKTPLNLYGYLQTYAHLPRSEKGDVNGYFQRSTEEEVIRYLDNYLNQFSKYRKIKRLEKLNSLGK